MIFTVEVGILLSGYLYGNNSIITLHDIGEESKSLFCITNNTKCCKKDGTFIKDALGNWYFPDESAIPTGNTNNFYKNRGPSVVRLHRRQNASGPNGIYHCTIPDNNEISQSIFVGIYPMGDGKN